MIRCSPALTSATSRTRVSAPITDTPVVAGRRPARPRRRPRGRGVSGKAVGVASHGLSKTGSNRTASAFDVDNSRVMILADRSALALIDEVGTNGRNYEYLASCQRRRD